MLGNLALLPEALQQKSLSKREIVLLYEDALQALDILENAGWAVIRWEPWLKLPLGSHLHPLMGGSFPQSMMEDWAIYVHRSAQLCRHMLQEEQQSWDQGTFLPQDDLNTSYWQVLVPSMILYFCLTVYNGE